MPILAWMVFLARRRASVAKERARAGLYSFYPLVEALEFGHHVERHIE